MPQMILTAFHLFSYSFFQHCFFNTSEFHFVVAHVCFQLYASCAPVALSLQFDRYALKNFVS